VYYLFHYCFGQMKSEQRVYVDVYAQRRRVWRQHRVDHFRDGRVSTGSNAIDARLIATLPECLRLAISVADEHGAEMVARP
jgi:hypothetical protein